MDAEDETDTVSESLENVATHWVMDFDSNSKNNVLYGNARSVLSFNLLGRALIAVLVPHLVDLLHCRCSLYGEQQRLVPVPLRSGVLCDSDLRRIRRGQSTGNVRAACYP